MKQRFITMNINRFTITLLLLSSRTTNSFSSELPLSLLFTTSSTRSHRIGRILTTSTAFPDFSNNKADATTTLSSSSFIEPPLNLIISNGINAATTRSDNSNDISTRITTTGNNSNYLPSTTKETYIAFAKKGADVAQMSKCKILHQSILAGCYVGFGGLLAMTIAGNLPTHDIGIVKAIFGTLLPFNLFFCILSGGQMFTGNTSTVMAAKLEGYVDKWKDVIKSWTLSLLGNFIGCVIMAYATKYTGLLIPNSNVANFLTSSAIIKCNVASFGQNFIKAIMCNWLVSLSLLIATGVSNNDIIGKFISVIIPCGTFVASGLEHSLANMYFLSSVLLVLGSNNNITLAKVIWKNWIPVILGNAVAGALLFAPSYSYQFGQLGQQQKQKRQKQEKSLLLLDETSIEYNRKLLKKQWKKETMSTTSTTTSDFIMHPESPSLF